MEWCRSLNRTRSEGGRMKRPDRGAKSYVEGVASSSTSVPRGRKDKRARKKQPRQDESYTYPMLMGGAFSPATREKHLIRSLSQSALLCLHPVIPEISRSLLPLSNHITRPIPGSPCSLPSLTKRHLPEFSSESLSIRSFANSNLFRSARLPTQSPSSPS